MMKLLALLVVLRSVWATDFSIKTSKTEGNDADFASDTEGLCAVLLESCDVIMDCSAMSSYACSSISSSTITEVSGEYQMLFTGVVAEPYTECGESSCQDCTAYKTCVGPMIQTDSQTLEAGNCILWEYTTVGGSDAFEIFVGVFDADGVIITGSWIRGASSSELPWNYNQLQLESSGTYYMKFYLASYDASGGGALGARMDVRNIRSSTCLDESQLGTEITETTVTEYISTTSSSSSATTITETLTATSSTTVSGTSTTKSDTSTTSSTSTKSSTTSSSLSSTTSRTSSSTSSSSSFTSSSTTTSRSTTSSSSFSSTITSSSTSSSSSSSITHSSTTSSTTTITTSFTSTTSNTFTSTSSSSSSSSQTRSSTTSITRTASSFTSTSSTQTESSTSTSSSSSATSTSITSTAFPEDGLSAAELQALEDERKALAAEAVAAVDAAELQAVQEALAALQSSNSSTPGVLGEVSIPTDKGPVKVAALSLQSLANLNGPAKVSAGADTGTSLEISAGLLGEVAATAGSETVLLSVASLNSAASNHLKTDSILADGRRLSTASALRSQPISVNFRAPDGAKIDVTNLAKPMKMELQVDDPDATCAYWDEATAQWSSEGVETLPHEQPGLVVCRTTHLSIFGGIIKVALQNVALALKCSTFTSLMNEAAFRNLGKSGWLTRPAAVCLIMATLILLTFIYLSARADVRSFDTLPWSEREMMLMRIKAKEPEEEDEKPPEKPPDPVSVRLGGRTEDDLEVVDYEDEHKRDAIVKSRKEEVEKEPKEPKEPKEKEEAKYEKKEDKEKEKEDKEEKDQQKEDKEDGEQTETAAGGDLEVPSMFRTVRGMAENLLDMASNAMGGEGFLDGIKEIVGNAETGTINRSIEMLQSHRTGADQTTIKNLQRGTLEVSGQHTLSELNWDAEIIYGTVDKVDDVNLQSPETVASDQVKPNTVADEMNAETDAVKRGSVETLEVQSLNTDDDHNRRDPAPPPVRNRRRSSVGEMIDIAVTVARRRGSEMMAKATVMYGRLADSGSGAATRFLNSNVFCRMLLLFPAAHNWARVNQLSITVPYSVRVALIGMKVFSAFTFNAVFFSSTSPAPDSDPKCFPKQGTFESLVQRVTVGIVSALLGDLIILLLLLFVKKNVEERPEWTAEMKRKRRRKWFWRTCIFWVFVALYLSFCVLYMCSFLSNVREADAAKWLESSWMSLLQDFILKPLILAAILAAMSSLVLYCRPSLKRKIEEKWLENSMERRDSFGSSESEDEVGKKTDAEQLASAEERKAEESGLRAMRSMLGDEGTEENRRLPKAAKESQAENGFMGVLPGTVPS